MKIQNILFLHGGPGCPEYLKAVLGDAFPKFIQPHFYQQQKTADTGVEDLIRQLRFELDKIEDSNVCLAGHSWGGTLALEYLKQTHDPRISHLILISSPIDKKAWVDEYQVIAKSLGPAAEDPHTVFLAPKERAMGAAYIDKIMDGFNEAMFEKIEREYALTLDLSEVVKNLNIPTLNIYGSLDMRIAPKCSRELKDLNPAIENLEIEEGGHFHFIHPEHRKILVHRIIDFVSH